MTTKKTKEKDTKTTNGKKTATKPKTTKKETVKLEDQKVAENVEIKEEEKPVVVEKVIENTVEEVTVEVNIAEIADNTIPEPTEEQISEMKEMANGDDEKFKYAQSMMDNVQKVTQQEETNECNVVSVTQGISSQTCIEEKQVQELAEEAKQEVKPKTRWFGRRKFSWMGKIFDI